MASLADRLRRVPVERLARLVSAATYGTVLVLGALSVISVAQVSVGYGAELVAGVGVATWVAHLFAEVLGGHVSRRRPLERIDVLGAVVEGSPILASSVLPACVLLLGRLNWVTDSAARAIAIVVAMVQLLGIGVLVGRIAPARPAAAWLFGAVTVGIGFAVVVVTVWLRH